MTDDNFAAMQAKCDHFSLLPRTVQIFIHIVDCIFCKWEAK